MLREGDRGLSVVPLLQERFRQLQRMKELRQGQELLKMLSESERSNNTPPAVHNYELITTDKFTASQQMLQFPPNPKPQRQLLSLSLWPDSSPIIFKHEEYRGANLWGPSNLSKSLFTDAPLVCALPITLDQNSASASASTSDIDTSLRL